MKIAKMICDVCGKEEDMIRLEHGDFFGNSEEYRISYKWTKMRKSKDVCQECAQKYSALAEELAFGKETK